MGQIKIKRSRTTLQLAPTRDLNLESSGPQSRVVTTILPLHTGAHYLTINSPDGADSSLNKLLLLVLEIFEVFSTESDSLYAIYYSSVFSNLL